MLNKMRLLFLSLVFLLYGSKLTLACTTFYLESEKQPVYGRNFDWSYGEGSIFINKRGVEKTAVSNLPDDDEEALRWVSKYGSATFNLFGREFPLGGMNEAGLVVESMILEETSYPVPDSRAELMVSQWIQYQLDRHSTVHEVLGSDKMVRIQPSRDSKLHFLVCDESGLCASIEFIEGALISHSQDQMPVKVLTNSSYAESYGFLNARELPASDPNRSVERFVQTAKLVQHYGTNADKDAVEYAFHILKRAEHDSYPTQWGIVYDLAGRTIYYRTHENQGVRHFRLDDFDLSCHEPVKTIDINFSGIADVGGDVGSDFSTYSYEDNRNSIRRTFLGLFFSRLPEDVLKQFASYPDTTHCHQ